MFEYLKTIETNQNLHYSSWFKILNDKAYYICENELFEVECGISKSLKKYSGDNVQLTKAKEHLLIGNHISGYDIFSDGFKNNDPVLPEFKCPFDSNSNTVYAFHRDRKLKKYESGLYDIANEKFLVKKPSLFNVMFSEGHFHIDSDYARISEKFEIIWNIDFSRFSSEPFEIIGIIDSELFISFRDNSVRAFSLKTGKATKEWLGTSDYTQIGKQGLPTSSFFIDYNRKRLIASFHTFIIEISLDTEQIHYLDIKETLVQNNISTLRSISNMPTTNSLIILSGHAELEQFKNVDINCLVAIDKETRLLKWKHYFGKSMIGINRPFLISKHLFQIDSDNKIHIFERK